MKKCPACGTENQAASQFCEECGTMLQVKISDAKQSAEFSAQSSDKPVFQSSSATSIGISPSAFESRREKEFFDSEKNKAGVHATIIIERGSATGTKFPIISDESFVGRWDADNGVFPDVDLDKHDPEAKISRRHARIRRSNDGKYTIEDLGSTNGTFINRGRRLIPGTETPLGDGDEIIIGKTFLRFHVSR